MKVQQHPRLRKQRIIKRHNGEGHNWIKMFIFFKRNPKRILAAFLLLLLCAGFLFRNLYITKRNLLNKYQLGIDLVDEGDYQEAIDLFNDLGDYKESLKYIEQAKNGLTYERAILLFRDGQYELAVKEFTKIEDYLDSKKYIERASAFVEADALYNEAHKLYEAGKFAEALAIFEKLDNYEDSEQLASNVRSALSRLLHSDTIAAGIRYSAGVTQKGTVVFSGQNFAGESELNLWQDIVSIAVCGDIVLGLKPDGTVVSAERETDYRIDVREWSDIVAIAVGEQYVVGLKEDGTLTAQGHNGDGQTNIDGWNNIVCIDAGWRHTVGLDAAGNIYITGYGSKRQMDAIEKNREQWCNIVTISAGGGGEIGQGHTVALKRDGTVVAVGDNTYGQCDVNDWTDIIAVSAGDFHTVGLKADGSVIITNADQATYEEISTWSDIVAISAGYGFTLGLKSDGTVVAAGYDKDGQRDVDSWENIALHEEWNFVLPHD